ncbi:MAG: hypothetical protein ACKOAG_12425 [Candidatus Kapaibacterium sp.]
MKPLLVFATLWMSTVYAAAQQGGAGTPAGSTAPGSPIDVPDIIVKGSATLRLMTTTFLKQTPMPTSPLSRKEMDSLNPKVKNDILALAPVSPPDTIPKPVGYDGIVSVSVGMFQTPELTARFSGPFLGYAGTATASYVSTEGYQAATDMHSLAFGIDGRRVFTGASGPFGADYHEWSLTSRSMGYALFATPDSAMRRDVSRFAVSTVMEHAISSMSVRSEVALGSVSMGESLTSTKRTGEQQLRLKAEMRQRSEETEHRLDLAFDLRPFASVLMSDNVISYGVSTPYLGMEVDGKVGLRGGTDSEGSQKADIVASLGIRKRFNPSIFAGLTMFRDIRNTFFSQTLAENPYVRSDARFDFTRIRLGSELIVRYTPSRTFTCDLRLGLEDHSSFLVPVSDSGSAFRLSYVPATRTRLRAHAQWQIGPWSQVDFNGEVRSIVDEDGNMIPYQASTVTRCAYIQRFDDRWTAEIAVASVSSRRTSMTGSVSLPGYLYVDGRVEFAMTQVLAAFLSAQNLTNSSIFVFERYRERTAFGSLGIQWKF